MMMYLKRALLLLTEGSC